MLNNKDDPGSASKDQRLSLAVILGTLSVLFLAFVTSRTSRRSASPIPGTTVPDSSTALIPEAAQSREESAVRQEELLRRQIKQAKILNWITGIAALAAMVYGVVAFFQWRDAHRNFRVDERAWMQVVKADLPDVKAGPSYGGTVRIQNTGKTPAKKVVEQFLIEKVRNGDSPRLDYSESHPGKSRNVIFPQFGEDFQAFWISKGDQQGWEFEVVTADDEKDFQTGDAYWVLFGRIDYWDIFGNQHSTTFCTWNGNQATRRNFTARKCADYNNADANE